jgi:hypothetical protein
MDYLARLAAIDPLFKTTASITVDPNDDADMQRVVSWWLELTDRS